MIIYLLSASTGEFDDYREWIAAAYTTREQAELHQGRLEQMVQPRFKEISSKKAEEIRSTLDPKFQKDNTGVSYEVLEVALWRHFDEFLENFPHQGDRP